MDREIQSSYDVLIIIRDNATMLPLYNLTKVTVDILDENDNPPVFDNQCNSSVIHVSEGTSEGTAIGQVQAYDADEQDSLNSQILYQLGNNTESDIFSTYFVINDTTGELSTTNVPIDREVHTNFSLFIWALNPDNVISDVCLIKVVIDDVNDEKPTFTTESMVTEFIVYEEFAEFGTAIHTFSATDNDTYPNNIVWFTIEESPNNDNHFYIENDITDSTGTLKISKVNVSSVPYELTITVQNINGTELINAVKETLTIYIISNPTYSINIEPVKNTTWYREEIGNFTLSIETDSYGNDEDISFEIIEETFQEEIGSKTIVSTMLIINTDGELSINSSAGMGRYVTVVKAFNISEESIYDQETVFITIVAVNNTAPKFIESVPPLIQSDTKIETEVFKLNATDKEHPELGNGEIMYSITKEENITNGQRIFSINPTSGSISLLLSPAEISIATRYTSTIINVTVDVQVYDLSVVSGVDNATLEFRIQLPSPSPVITYAPLQYYLKEEQDPMYLFQITAKDGDTSSSDGPLSFELDGSGAEFFEINNDGNVSSKVKFNCEKGDSNFEIVVVVSNPSSLKDYAVVVINIEDINDNLPTFKESFAFDVFENHLVNDTVGYVYAYDDDIGSSNNTNTVNYKLLGMNSLS
ncbi:protocadherin Fat 4-like [Antedon mediterranea]|uniref:protocadherin Fat 4-like n=1 Tax=Antedon mediterranea TaxID=105859 RepID=UPI003AF53082